MITEFSLKNVVQALPRGLALVVLTGLLLLPSPSAVADTEQTDNSGSPDSAVTLGSLLEEPALLSELENKSRPFGEILDKVHSLSHYVHYQRGRRIFVTEYFSLRSILRQPARAVIFLTGQEFRGNFWSIPVEGYNAPEMAARRGFFAYTVDYVGVGESFLPEDGSQVNYLFQVQPIRSLIDSVRRARRVHRVDLVGEGYGGEVASELADEPERVRSVTMSTVVYKNYSPPFLAFLSDDFEAFLRSHKDGYWKPNFLRQTLARSPNQDLRDYVFSTQLNVYPTGPHLQFWDFGLPTINAAAARVPCLVVTGEHNPLPAAGDMEELVRDWGGGGELVVILGANHVPRVGSARIAAEYFEALFGFIDAH